jgi:purine-binding chemotaxis protein CheW
MTNNSKLELTTFYVDGAFVGFDVRFVREVLKNVGITRVPQSHRDITGLANVRGQIASVIDLGSRLELVPRPPAHRDIQVLVRSRGETFGLGVDVAGGVVEVDARSYESPPVQPPKSLEDVVLGAFALEGELLLLLDVEKIVDLDMVDVA